MNCLYGAKMYYSLFGAPGLLVGARARLSSAAITMTVAVPRIDHPIYLRARTTDVALCRDILLNRAYESEFDEPPRVIVDAGANIGLASVFYANKFPDARIIAVEPERSNFEMLRRNTAPYLNVTPVQVALWKENRPVNMLDTGKGNTTFRTQLGDEDSEAEKAWNVAGVTLDRLMAEYGIERVNLLKVDIEGAEKDVFEHSQAWIDRVDIIAVELHDWICNGCGESVRLAAKDFKIEWQRGETTYLARREVAHKASFARQTDDPSGGNNKFPLKILYSR
jgi:FkbM family methyltransferase